MMVYKFKETFTINNDRIVWAIIELFFSESAFDFDWCNTMIQQQRR